MESNNIDSHKTSYRGVIYYVITTYESNHNNICIFLFDFYFVSLRTCECQESKGINSKSYNQIILLIQLLKYNLK